MVSKYLPSDFLEFPKVIPTLQKFLEHSRTSEVSGRVPALPRFPKVPTLPELWKLFILSEVAYLAIVYCRSLQACLRLSHKLSFPFSFLSRSCTLLGSG